MRLDTVVVDQSGLEDCAPQPIGYNEVVVLGSVARGVVRDDRVRAQDVQDARAGESLGGHVEVATDDPRATKRGNEKGKLL